MQKINLQRILQEYPWINSHITIKNTRFTIPEFLEIAIFFKDAKTLSEHLKCNRSTIAIAVKKDIPEFSDKGKKTLSKYILSKFNLNQCYTCSQIKSLEDFYNSSSQCKECSKDSAKNVYEKNKEYYRSQQSKYYTYFRNSGKLKERSARNRASRLERTPSWANQKKIKEIYANCPEGHHVDHIIPLQGEKVSGLHVETNLQYLTAEENLKKSNKFNIEGQP